MTSSIINFAPDHYALGIIVSIVISSISLDTGTVATVDTENVVMEASGSIVMLIPMFTVV